MQKGLRFFVGGELDLRLYSRHCIPVSKKGNIGASGTMGGLQAIDRNGVVVVTEVQEEELGELFQDPEWAVVVGPQGTPLRTVRRTDFLHHS